MNDDTYMPPAQGTWSFHDPAVASLFDKMLPLSIPDYSTMRWLTTNLALNDLDEVPVIADLGSSRGDAIAPIAVARPLGHFHLWEQSIPMQNVLNDRFQYNRNVTVHGEDLRNEAFVSSHFDRVLSVLTLMFIPVEYRASVLARIHNSLRPNGVFFLVEKTLQENEKTSRAFTKEYYAMKSRNGYSDEQIERKRLSLEGVLVPLPMSTNEQMLRHAGFSHIECYWKALHFTGWMAYK